MANITKNKKNNKGKWSHTVHFMLNGKSKSFGLPSKYGKTILGSVERVVTAIEEAQANRKRSLLPADQTIYNDLPKEIQKKMKVAGLVERVEELSLEGVWDKFFDLYQNEAKIKDSTMTTYVTSRKRFFREFRGDSDPNDLTKADCEEWLDSLDGQYKEGTIANTLKACRTVFHWAQEKGIIEENPFKGITGWSFENKGNEFFITMEVYRKLLDACPDQTWRTLLTLCRVGGLRNPTETFALTWGDINWDKGTVFITDSKRKRYGKGTRLIPLYEDLRVELGKQFEQAEESGSPFVIDRWRDRRGRFLFRWSRKKGGA